jgi:hypothetical protein
MIFWPFFAFIWFENIEKMLLQMTSGFLQLESTIQADSRSPFIRNFLISQNRINMKIVRHSLMTNRKISSRAITMATKKFLGNFL